MKAARRRRSSDPRRGAGGARARPGVDPFRVVADYTYDWESWIGANGELRWVNPAVRTLTGYTVNECLKMADYPLPIVHPEDRAYLSEVLRGARGGSRGNDLEFRVLRKDGSFRWAAMSWQSIQDAAGNDLGYRTSVRDIDERKKMEERLRLTMHEAESAARAKAEFLATTSHELRHPIQAIQGYADLLLARGPTGVQRRHLEIIREQGEALLRAVDDILAYSAADANRLSLVVEPFELHREVASIVSAVRPLAAAKGLKLSCRIHEGVPRRVAGDALRLHQVLSNLLGNAVKFTESGSVRVEVKRGQGSTRAAPVVCFTVSDTGIGLPEEAVERLFEPFTQGDAASARRFGGSGLGLAIAKRLTDRMNGSLVARRRRPKGSVFTLTLPFEPATRIAERAGVKPEARRRVLPPAFRVLVVDDSPIARELTLELFALLGVGADAVGSAEEAVRAVTAAPYDLVLLDIQMPGIDGFAAAKMIRAVLDGKARSARFVALTADVFAERSAAAAESNMDAFLIKPVRIQQLAALLDGGRVAPRRTKARAVRRSLPAALDADVVQDLISERSRDGAPLLDKVAKPLMHGSDALVRDLEEALESWEWARAELLAHRLKGDCRVVGARDAARAADALEAAAASRNARAWRRLMPELREALRVARAALVAVMAGE